MIKLEKGGEYKAARVRSGTSQRGDWELVVVKADGKARQEITIFPSNTPSGVQEGEQFILKDILGVTIKKKKDADGNWTKEEVAVSAELEALEPVSLDDVSSSDFGDLGFGSTDIDDIL